MTFWNLPELTPKQSHNWLVEIRYEDGQGLQLLPYFLAKSMDRPSYNLKSKNLDYLYSHKINFPTRVEWNPITIQFYDAIFQKVEYGTMTGDSKERDIEPPSYQYIETIKQDIQLSASKSLNYSGNSYIMTTQGYFSQRFLSKAGYKGLSENNFMKNYTFKNTLIDSFASNKTYFRIYYLANDTQKLAWDIINPIVTSVSFSDLSYETDSVSLVNVTLSYDNAIMTEPR